MDLEQEDEPKGPAAWVMTFADLMSLLMCFFVLLLSFSEIDAMKFKQIAGSLQAAFGVQRDVPATDIPMGTSPIFDDFSPGIPEPTPIEEVRQTTSEQLPQHDTLREQLEAAIEQKIDLTALAQVKTTADSLSELLEEEVMDGKVNILSDRKRVIIRVEERGSFPSGSADMTYEFESMLLDISEVLSRMPGEITVEGHTDDIPISTARFRSNWDLSAARASSVANALLQSGAVEPHRLRVQGYADTRPRASNDFPDTRALNRRVEIIIDASSPLEEYEARLRALIDNDLDQLVKELELQDGPQQ
ncbi:flagellar motor protein MotB [Halopseudomonas salegens]|uniref:Chemotaxis protein MotB n=1 Tax=Halopseudomonas salegens TaxID=1434072 RepID=A0A1H2EKV3_9GAMM|nr:flagellar motor protein MotB [Halopseudomonas salegens]SDT95711.1 chemotaxis protein MotB [Halopseudomonas salegens]